jgi:hypothetical protein
MVFAISLYFPERWQMSVRTESAAYAARGAVARCLLSVGWASPAAPRNAGCADETRIDENR